MQSEKKMKKNQSFYQPFVKRMRYADVREKNSLPIW